MNLGNSPLNSQCSPPQRTRGSDGSGVAQSITQRRRVRRESIRFSERRGKLEPGVLAELHKETDACRAAESLERPGQANRGGAQG